MAFSTKLIILLFSISWIDAAVISNNQEAELLEEDLRLYLNSLDPDSEFDQLEMSHLLSSPCTCTDLTCLCCARATMKSIKLDHQICTNFTMNPNPSRIETSLIYNEKPIYHTHFNVGNPGPMCCPMPVMPVIYFCINAYDVVLTKERFSTCMDFQVNFFSKSLLRIPFDCLQLGQGGLSLHKNV